MSDRNFRDELWRALEVAASSGNPADGFRELARYEGERVYLARGHSPQKKSELIGSALATGTGLLEAAQHFGLSRRTAFRIAGRRWRVI